MASPGDSTAESWNYSTARIADTASVTDGTFTCSTILSSILNRSWGKWAEHSLTGDQHHRTILPAASLAYDWRLALPHLNVCFQVCDLFPATLRAPCRVVTEIESTDSKDRVVNCEPHLSGNFTARGSYAMWMATFDKSSLGSFAPPVKPACPKKIILAANCRALSHCCLGCAAGTHGLGDNLLGCFGPV